MTNNKTFLTEEGLQNLVNELDQLKQKKEAVISRLEDVSQPDESGEDGLSSQLKEEIGVLSDKIETIENAIRNASLINGNDLSTSAVSVGSRVKLKVSGSTEKEFHIVSHLESDPTQNKISDQSPLGMALLGKKVKDEIAFDAPVGKIIYKIVSIN